MELKQRLSTRKIFVGLYFLAFAIYLVVGLQPAGATNYEVSTKLVVPKIGLNSDVTTLTLDNNSLNTPDEIVGSYSQAKNKTLLIGHSATVFENLYQVALGDGINYDYADYKIVAIDMVPKYQIEMSKLLSSADRDTLVIMTCAGRLLDGGDATHRLIVTAIKL